MEQVV